MELYKSLEQVAKDLGAFYFGVADLSLTKRGVITPHEQRLVSEYPFAISIGVPLATQVVERIGDQSDLFALRNYWFHVYQVINHLIDNITSRLSFILMSEGYPALPVPASQTLDNENLYGFFSHKLAASLSGLGWVGKSCLLITPDRGPRVRWGTILTNAPLETGKPMVVKCGKCVKCVEACPAEAFTGRDFVSSEPRETRMIAKRCYDFLSQRRKDIGAFVCGNCVHICPWGIPKGYSQIE